jgi:hypothetical protein
LIQIFILNSNDSDLRLKELFEEGYNATDFEKQFLSDCFLASLTKLESKIWEKFTTNLAIALLLIKINNKNAVGDFFILYEALLAIVCIKSNVIFYFQATNFLDLSILTIEKYPWVYRFIRTALSKYQGGDITAVDLEALHTRFTTSVANSKGRHMPNYNYLIQAAFPEL